MSLKIWPYKRFSKSAKVLARMLGVKRIVSPNYRPRRKDIIINWGNSRAHSVELNPPNDVINATDKLSALALMKTAGVSVPEFTTQLSTAQEWLNAGRRVVARTLLTSHSGKGAIVVEPGQELPVAPLYTRYIRRDAEFRVHVFNGKVIDYARKKRRNGYSENLGHNDHIRTHLNGWVYCRTGVSLPEVVSLEALKAVAALQLDFGAVDVLFREQGNKAFVLETNTAPGLEGQTISKYAAAIREYTVSRQLS